MFCQSCGARNPGDARFCNKCGTRIASEGEPGGPLDDVASDAAPVSTASPGHTKEASAAESPPSESRPPEDPPSEAASEENSLATASTEEAPPSATEAEEPSAEPEEPYVEERPSRSSYAPPRRDPGEPPSGMDISTMSLSRVGIRSPAKAWGTLIAAALFFITLGAGAAWLAMQSSAEEQVASNEGEGEEDPEGYDPESDVEIGDPLPEGEDLPDVDVVTGSPRPSARRSGSTSTRRRTGTSRSGSSGRSGSGGSGSGTSGSTGSGSTGGSGSSGSGTSGSGTSGSGSGTSGSGTSGSGSVGEAWTSSGSGTSGSGTSGSGSSGSGSTGSTGGGTETTQGSAGGGSGSTGGSNTVSDAEWEAMEEEMPEERDFAMEAYSTRLRSFIRTYYARRAQGCFDHETRNNPDIHGTVVVSFQIQADGNVRSVRSIRNSTGSEALERCLVGQVSTWRLPQPPEAPLEMQMPFSR